MAMIGASTESEQWRQLVAGARARLAELEVDYTREKLRADAVQAVLFRHLRGHHQKRDRLRLMLEYRQQFLDSYVRDDRDEVEQAEHDLKQAKAQLDEDYEELAAAAEKKKNLTAESDAELARLWEKLVKLNQPDRFAHEPDKLAACQNLAAAIHHAKNSGDLGMLREIAEDPQSFMLRQGWAELNFTEISEPAQLKKLNEMLQSEIAAVTESLKALRASADYELCQLVEKKPGYLDELVAERAKQLEVENAELEKQAEELAIKIKKLSEAS